MSDDKHQPFATDKLVEAYNRMMERARSAVGAGLQPRLEKAKEVAVELGELTRDEAERVAAYLRRDLQDTARHLADSGKELRAWLRFDLQQIENRMLETFSKLVDHSRVELGRFSSEPEDSDTWHTGEVAGIGTLLCDSCGEALHFHATGRIPPCPKCRGTLFHRDSPPI